ncbi:MAG: glycosyltransferase [Lachnospiraceae bacterium]|nr:glycosyltransferase [Lachnospiraceae bacterium]
MISIIVPIYNQSKYIDQCMKSIMSQNYKDIEVILIDDGSTDGSGNKCKQYVENNSNISYYFQENSGVSVARNVGMAKAKGDWIAFIDPDDYICDNMMTRMVECHLEYKDADIIACACYAFNDNEKHINPFFEKNKIFNSYEEKKELLKQLFNSRYAQGKEKKYTAIGVPWGKLYRKKFLDAIVLRFNKNLRRMQDNVFNMKAFWHASYVVYINEPLYMYRIDNISKYHKHNFNNYLMDNYLYVQAERRSFIESINNTAIDDVMNELYLGSYYEIIDILVSYVFNSLNPDNKNGKRRAFYKTIYDKNGFYDDTINNINLKSYRSFKDRIIINVLKSRSFELNYLFWNTRNFIKGIVDK